MRVFPELTKNTWRVLLSLSKADATPSEISKSICMPLSKVSVSIKGLTNANILQKRKGYEKIAIDMTLKNAIKNFINQYGHERFIYIVYGKRLNLLFQISEGYDTSKKLRLITGYSEPTLKRILKELQDSLLIYQPKIGQYKIRDEVNEKINLLKVTFLSYFICQLSTQGIEAEECKLFGDTAIIYSPQEKNPGFVKTGFSLFHKYKIIIFEPNRHYFVNFNREPTKEEVFLHSLVFSFDHQRNMILAILFAHLNKINLKKLQTLSLMYKVGKEVEAISSYLKTHGRITAKFLPRYKDYEEIRRDYER
jgi:DNA-binding MarR family transcriptional regulator